MAARRKVIITAGLTGAFHSKAENPNLPEQPAEIIEQALECREAGAAIVHIHARDQRAKSSMDLNIFRVIHDGIKRSSDLIVELSTGGGLTLTREERIAPISLKPEMASLNTFMAVFGINGEELPVYYTRSEIEHTARRALEMGVKPVMAVLNFSCIEEAENLIQKGLVEKPYCFTIGLDAPAQGILKGTPRNLLDLVGRFPENSIFTVAAFGEAQLPLATMSMLLGGHARVGLEDNLYYVPGQLAKGNAELVARVVRIVRELNLEVATPDEAREILQIHR